MSTKSNLGGIFTLADTDITLRRMRYGAMQLARSHVFGPPRDRKNSIAVLRAAVEYGVNHIDTVISTALRKEATWSRSCLIIHCLRVRSICFMRHAIPRKRYVLSLRRC